MKTYMVKMCGIYSSDDGETFIVNAYNIIQAAKRATAYHKTISNLENDVLKAHEISGITIPDSFGKKG